VNRRHATRHLPGEGAAWFGGRLARGVVETSADPAVLDRGGWWAVVITFEGEVRLWRFRDVMDAPLPPPPGRWRRAGGQMGDVAGL
jgi:para-aminobenzoate synthetase component 1